MSDHIDPEHVGWEYATLARESILDEHNTDADSQALVSIAFSLDRIADALSNMDYRMGNGR